MFLVDLLRQLPTDYCLVMAGEGILRDDILCRASEYGISDRVHLIGTISQKHLPALYRAAHVFLLPSTYEIYGMVMLEEVYKSALGYWRYRQKKWLRNLAAEI